VPYLAPHLAVVTAATTGADGYFPERRLAEWLAEQEQPSTIYTFEKVGVAALRAAYARLVEELAVEAIVLVDGAVAAAMPEGRAYLSAVSHAHGRTPTRASIVNGSIDRAPTARADTSLRLWARHAPRSRSPRRP
jgi:hypothetical protein